MGLLTRTTEVKLPQRVVDELSRSGPLKGKILASKLRVPLHRVQQAICCINHSKKKYNVMIIRTGEWRESVYKIVDNRTSSDDIKDNIDFDDRSLISKTRKRTKLFKMGKATRSSQQLEAYMNSVISASMETLREVQQEFRTNNK